jgi:uncharacterized protein DUF4382/carboxypeptidase family protein
MDTILSRVRFYLTSLVILTALGLWGCGSGGTGELSVGLSSSSGGGSGLAGLTTASSSGDVDAVFVTVERVDVHVSGEDQEVQQEDQEEQQGQDVDNDNEDGDEGGGWMTVAAPMQTFNLMDLQNCLLEKLGSAKLPAGKSVTQIRLILSATPTDGHTFANYVVINGVETEIKVPSGLETGIKINPQGPVEIQEDGEVHVTLVIDLDKSLVFTGNGKILFKPVVLATVGGEDADAFVSGKVTKDADSSAIEGANVSASKSDGSVENSATTDTDGNYRFCVAPGTYTVTASHDGFESSSQEVTVSGEGTATADFKLKALNP